MKILAIDTSCDDTSAAVIEDTTILSNIIWSQASLHAKFGGVMPSLAQREHEEHIDWVINKAILNARCHMINIDAIAITAGPGLAIALGVGIKKAKELVIKYNKPLIAINHLEGHVLSSLACPKTEISKSKLLISKQFPIHKSEITNNLPYTVSHTPITFPALGLVISGGNTLLVQINEIGNYKTLATTVDDALGEALDKAARMLGLGYPGGAILEKFAKKGDLKTYPLPIPIVGQEYRKIFSYSGLKTSMYRLVESEKKKSKGFLTKKQIYDLAACFQNTAFTHLIRVIRYILVNGTHSGASNRLETKDLFVGGGVIANLELRKRLRKLGKEFNIKIRFPYTKKLSGDNAAMIGITAYYKFLRKNENEFEKIDREAQAKIDIPFKWEYNR